MMFYLALSILIVSIAVQVFLKFKNLVGKTLAKNVFKLILLISVILIFSFSFYNTRQLFLTWQTSPPSKYLIPPYRSIYYFLSYSFFHFYIKYLISFGISLFFLAFFKYINKKKRYRFFENEEPYIAGVSIFILPHPWCFIYLIAIFLIGIIGTALLKFRGSQARFPFYYFWLWPSLAILLVSKFLV